MTRLFHLLASLECGIPSFPAD